MSEETPQRSDSLNRRRSANAILSQVIRKYWPTTLATLLLVFVGTVFFTLGKKKIYQAEATIEFNPRPARPLGSRIEEIVDIGSETWWANQEYFETQYKILQSRRVATAVVNELGLHNDAGYMQNTPPAEEPRAAEPAKVEEAAELLRSRIKVEPIKESRLAVVSYQDADPERAQRVLMALCDIYVVQNLQRALDSTSAANDWLRQQLDKLKADLEGSEMDLHRYKKTNDILSVQFDDKSNILRGQISFLNQELTRAQADMQRASARMSVLSGVPEDDPTLITSTELLNNTLLSQLRSDYERAVGERDAKLGEGKGPKHPEVLALQKRVDRAEEAVLKEIRNIKKAVARDVAVLGRQAGGLSGMLDKAKATAHELNKLEIEHNRLQRERQNNEKLYGMVLERTKEADLSQMLRVNNISVLDRALMPKAPVLPKVPLNLAVGLVLGLLLGIAAAFVRGMFDRTVKVPDDIELDFGVTFLGLLPEMSNAKATYYGRKQRKRQRGRRVDPDGKPELVVHHAPASGMAEAARVIRTNLMFMAPDNPYRTLLVTSAGPSEGKTTVACCIAVAMAQAGQRVAIIDCDLRRPRVPPRLRRDDGRRRHHRAARSGSRRLARGNRGAQPRRDVVGSDPAQPGGAVPQ